MSDTGQRSADDVTAVTGSNHHGLQWDSPMVTLFSIVLGLFLLTLLLAAVNVYIWYIKRHKRRDAGLDPFRDTAKRTTLSQRRKSNTTNLAFVLVNKPRE